MPSHISQTSSHSSIQTNKNEESEVVDQEDMRFVFSLGDCAGDIKDPLPSLAQVAAQQGFYLARCLNSTKGDLNILKECYPPITNASNGLNGSSSHSIPKFKYRHLGSMAAVGGFKAIVDATEFGKDHLDPPPPRGTEIQGKDEDIGDGSRLTMKGFMAWLAWRSAYWTKTVSISNKILIPMFWFKSFVFGRDISRF